MPKSDSDHFSFLLIALITQHMFDEFHPISTNTLQTFDYF